MRDPFFIAPVEWLQRAIQPVADTLQLRSLPLHIHEVLAAALLYGFIYYPLSPLLSRTFFPRIYPQLPRRRRINWDAHVVSLVQSCLINALALWVMLSDDERNAMGSDERVWGYTGACGMVQGLAAGYFLWDLIVTSRNMDVFGLGTLAHAVSALVVYSLGFRPFVNYYASTFILWELSTPFLNIHWFLDKLGMTGSPLQLYNGIILITTFFSCRLLYGTYQSFRVLQDVWVAVGANPNPSHFSGLKLESSTMEFANEQSTVPLWLAVSYLASNMVLNSLNCYWFFKMIQALTKRFEAPKVTAVPEEDASGTTTATKPTAALKSRAQAAKDADAELDVVI